MYNKKLVFLAACTGMLFFGIGLITLGSIAPDLKSRFELDNVAAGTLFSILPIGILAGSLLFGPVCDRYGYKLMMVLSCLGMCLGFEVIANTGSVTWLKVFIFVFGFCAGIINGATNAVVSDISKGTEGANLSLLGVFFGIGALGMPFAIGALKDQFTSWQILQAVGWFILFIGICYLFIAFPPSKRKVETAGNRNVNIFKESYLYYLAFFLFFQGSIEAILNNWTTSYLDVNLSISESAALYALSSYVAGLTIMRLVIGSVLRNVALRSLMMFSFAAILGGILFIHFANGYAMAVAGLVIMGVGLAPGFPIILGLAGNRYASQSGTVFSMILTIALVGNMLVNFIMGIISENFGIKHLTTVLFIEWTMLVVLFMFITRSMLRMSKVDVHG